MLATRMTCRLLGVPDADVPVFARWADALSPIFFIMTSEQIAPAPMRSQHYWAMSTS